MTWFTARLLRLAQGCPAVPATRRVCCIPQRLPVLALPVGAAAGGCGAVVAPGVMRDRRLQHCPVVVREGQLLGALALWLGAPELALCRRAGLDVGPQAVTKPAGRLGGTHALQQRWQGPWAQAEEPWPSATGGRGPVGRHCRPVWQSALRCACQRSCTAPWGLSAAWGGVWTLHQLSCRYGACSRVLRAMEAQAPLSS